MDTGKRKHLQDIYATDRTSRDDFTPQVSSEIVEERKREIRRHQFVSFVLGMIVLVLSVSLVYVVVREYIDIHALPPSPTPITQEYIPRYSLPSESQWVLDFSRDYANPKWTGEGERPFNSEWIKKAAFNVVMAEQASGVGKYAEAAEYYANALQILPNLEGVKVPLGMLYFKLKDFDKALALLENAPAADLTPDVLNNLGAACLNAKAYDRAESYLNQALEMQPSYAEAQKNLAALYKAQKRDDDAVAAYERYIDLRPADVDTQHTFALYLTKLGRWKQAADLLEQLTQEITDVPVLFFLLAQVETHNNQPDKAMAALKRGVQLSDPNSALAYMDSSEFEQLRESDEFQVMIHALEKPKK
ncbi:MAG: tetratricopeptide repeat protein [Kiritimatiellales bacterium]|nr:tetratricopeptide repeat protein [Kiritimatiellales bacterium]